MKFYTFSQNNSGGRFVIDESRGITYFVIIEANSSEEANKKAEDIGLYFNGCAKEMDCDCCGDRWSHAWDNEGDEVPMIYSTPLPELKASKYTLRKNNGKEIAVHYANGTIEFYPYEQ